MFRWLFSRVVLGIVLVLGGITLLLQNLNVFRPAGGLFWGAILLFAGAAFLSTYYEDRTRWWAFIPAFTLLGLGTSSLLDALIPSVGSFLGGGILLVGISLGFIAVYVVMRQFWWTIIPAGVLATLALVSVIDNSRLGVDSGGIFFLGIGLTFAILALLPGHEVMLRWAYIPAGVLILMGILISAASSNLINVIFPAILIVIGLIFVGRVVLGKRQ